jgi:hypothetical protein
MYFIIINFNTQAVATPGPEQDIHINKEGALWQYDASDQAADLQISDISGNQSMLGLSTGDESPSSMLHPQYVVKRQRRIACRCPNCVDNQGRYVGGFVYVYGSTVYTWIKFSNLFKIS